MRRLLAFLVGAVSGGAVVALALPAWWEAHSCLAAMQAELPTDDGADEVLDDPDAVPAGWLIDLCPDCDGLIQYTAPYQQELVRALHRRGCTGKGGGPGP